MSLSSPGVRRLCIGVGAPYPGLLANAAKSLGSGWLYLDAIHLEGVELGFASPGVDEAALVTCMIAALRTSAAAVASAARSRPVFAVFHVGITRVEGDDLRGAAVLRVRQLLHRLALFVAPPDASKALLVAGLSESLFDDLSPECGFSADWRHATQAGARFRIFETAHREERGL